MASKREKIQALLSAAALAGFMAGSVSGLAQASDASVDGKLFAGKDSCKGKDGCKGKDHGDHDDDHHDDDHHDD